MHNVITTNQFQVHTRYVTSANNPADTFSHGSVGPRHLQLPRIPIPSELSHLLIDSDAPLTNAERKECSSPRGVSYETKPRRRSQRDFEQWRLENEATLLSIFQNSTW